MTSPSLKGRGGRQQAGKLRKKLEKEKGGGRDTESNKFEEHVSNQILILARGKKRGRKEKRKTRRKRNGERRHEGVSLILWTDSEMNEEIVH